MVKIRIEIPSKDNDILLRKNGSMKAEVEQLKKENIADIDILYCQYNTLTLTQFGNKAIEECKEDYDYLILMHSDVSLSLYNFVKHLVKTEGRYDIVGVAGTKKLLISYSPLTWFTGSHNYPNDRYGRVTHNHNGIMIESFFNKADPTALDTEVVTIDGLLMCFNKKTMQNEKARFDERFAYDFYDLDFCLNVRINTDLKIGVIIMPTVHNSLGRSILKEEYKIPDKMFHDKWYNGEYLKTKQQEKTNDNNNIN